MQIDLDTIGLAGAALDEGERLADEGAHMGAREALDRADGHLAALREHYRALPLAARPLLGRLATPLGARRDALERRLPRATALAVVPVGERPVEEDEEPPEA